jgi:DUF2934 family protein
MINPNYSKESSKSNTMQNPTQQSNAPSYDEIACVAYGLWEQAGRPAGRDREFWFEAEQQLTTGLAAQVGGSGKPRGSVASDPTGTPRKQAVKGADVGAGRLLGSPVQSRDKQSAAALAGQPR